MLLTEMRENVTYFKLKKTYLRSKSLSVKLYLLTNRGYIDLTMYMKYYPLKCASQNPWGQTLINLFYYINNIFDLISTNCAGKCSTFKTYFIENCKCIKLYKSSPNLLSFIFNKVYSFVIRDIS